MRRLTDYDRHLIAARRYIDVGRYLGANEELEHIEPAEMRATIPVFVLRERIHRALGKTDLHRSMVRIIGECWEYAEREGIPWTFED